MSLQAVLQSDALKRSMVLTPDVRVVFWKYVHPKLILSIHVQPTINVQYWSCLYHLSDNLPLYFNINRFSLVIPTINSYHHSPKYKAFL